MLTELREKSQSFLIYILFGMLIIVFIFFFGLPAEGFRPGGDQPTSGWAAEVYGEEIPTMHVEIALRRQIGMGAVDTDAAELSRLRRETLLQLIDQEVVRQRAKAMGLGVSEDELSAYIVSDDNPDAILFKGQDGRFSYDRYEAQITQGFGGNTRAYRAMKERELLVDRYLGFLASQVKVGAPEVREAYEQQKRTWNLEYLVVDPADPALAVPEPTAAEGAAHAQANPKEVEAYYEANKAQYDREKEVRVRRILVRIPKDGGEAGKAEARKKIEELHAKVQAPEADFAAIAGESSEGYYKTQGGDMGWQARENTSPADYAVYEKLEPGQISDIQESPIGFWFVKADEVKPAVKKSLGEVSDEIGLKLVQQSRRKDAARQQAEAMLAKLKGGAPLAEVAPRTAAPTPPPDEEGEDDPVIEEEGPSPVRTTGNFSAERPTWDRIPGIGKSEKLARMLPGLTTEKPLVEEVLEVEDKLVLVRLKDRVEPTDEDFAKEKDAIADRLRRQRANQLFGQWRAVLFGPVAQREVFRKFSGGALLEMLPAPDGKQIEINEKLFPMVVAAAEPAAEQPARR